MNRSCDTCYHYLMKSGVFPHLVCLRTKIRQEREREQRRERITQGNARRAAEQPALFKF